MLLTKILLCFVQTLIIKVFCFFFFLEGTVTNPAIWLVLYPVNIFLSLPKGHGNAFVSRWVHQLSLPFFINISCFVGRAVFLSKHVGHYLRPINNLWILSFLSLFLSNHFGWQKNIGFRMNCISNSVITLVDKRPKNRLQLILIVHKKYLES